MNNDHEGQASKTSYLDAGVDIEQADAAKSEMASVMATKDRRILNGPGAFASLFSAQFAGIEDPVLVLKAEEPGSKQQLAFAHDRIESICRDLIHHLINDIAAMGAKPEAVLDVILCGKLEKDTVVRIVTNMAEACREQGCSLIGGETSEQPRVLPEGAYMLNASILGVVDRDLLIDGSRIRPGDTVLALASNGPHTNGYSLIRAIMQHTPSILEQHVEGESFLDAILKPHTCYYKPLSELFRTKHIHGLAHITGGGIAGNLNRILPPGMDAVIDLSRIEIVPVFKTIHAFGHVSPMEMLRTFNMGVGMTLVADPAHIPAIHRHLAQHGCRSYEIGTIRQGSGQVKYVGSLSL